MGEESRSSNHAHLFPPIGWRLQTLSAQGKARNCRCRIAPTSSGTRRDYQGRIILVKILADGFEHEGKIYESLSSIASVVTGTRWNGFSFFGLNKKVEHG